MLLTIEKQRGGGVLMIIFIEKKKNYKELMSQKGEIYVFLGVGILMADVGIFLFGR